MATIATVIGYVPLSLMADTIADFKTGYAQGEWSTTAATTPTGATAFELREGIEKELTVSDYLEQSQLTDLDPFHANSTVTPKLEWFDDSSNTWTTSSNAVNFDTDDFDDSGETTPSAADFTVESKSGDKDAITLAIPRKIVTNITGKYRLRITIVQDDGK